MLLTMMAFMMSKGLLITLIILGSILTILAVLYFVGRRMQKKQEASQAQIDAMKQTVSMLIIDKKKLRLKDSGLPAVVLAQTPKYMRIAKMPIVKAKVGPQIMTLVCDAAIYDSIPIKKEVKATVSGIYITEVRGLHGASTKVEQKKKGWWKRTVDKLQEKAGAKPIK